MLASLAIHPSIKEPLPTTLIYSAVKTVQAFSVSYFNYLHREATKPNQIPTAIQTNGHRLLIGGAFSALAGVALVGGAAYSMVPGHKENQEYLNFLANHLCKASLGIVGGYLLESGAKAAYYGWSYLKGDLNPQPLPKPKSFSSVLSYCFDR
jgi:hypothetical protein